MSLSQCEISKLDELLLVDGAFNFRDIGGHAVSPTESTRHATIYRSGHLGFLTDTGKSTLQDLGINLRIDLRNDSESAFVEKWATANKSLPLAFTSDTPPLPKAIYLPLETKQDDILLDRFLKYDSQRDSTPEVRILVRSH